MAGDNLQFLPAVVGPTASGKTGLGVRLCKELGGEVISCDSMQVYRTMPIATAQPTQEERQGVPHHLQGFLEPDEAFSVVDYCRAAGELVTQIQARGSLPVLVGGTGLYFNALTENMQFSSAGADAAYRAALQKRAAQAGTQSLFDELRLIDPSVAQTLHPNDTGRIIRALEMHRATGEKPCVLRRRARLAPPRFRCCVIGLDAKNRQVLYERINARVDEMLHAGLLQEAQRFFAQPKAPTARQAIGYKELLPCLQGQLSLEEAVANLKQATRRYAKRQLTWFRKNPAIHWFYIDTLSQESLAQQALACIRAAIKE